MRLEICFCLLNSVLDEYYPVKPEWIHVIPFATNDYTFLNMTFFLLELIFQVPEINCSIMHRTVPPLLLALD
jgi:hypothetical protein